MASERLAPAPRDPPAATAAVAATGRGRVAVAAARACRAAAHARAAYLPRAHGVAWPHQLPSLDKVIWSKSSATKVSGFHTDHFPFGSATCRSSGGATRVIANLGVHPRVVSFLLPNSAGQLPLGNEYCPREYKSLAGLLKGATLVFASLPAYSLESGVAGVQFDAHNVLHSGLPYQGAIAAVITNWTKYV